MKKLTTLMAIVIIFFGIYLYSQNSSNAEAQQINNQQHTWAVSDIIGALTAKIDDLIRYCKQTNKLTNEQFEEQNEEIRQLKKELKELKNQQKENTKNIEENKTAVRNANRVNGFLLETTVSKETFDKLVKEYASINEASKEFLKINKEFLKINEEEETKKAKLKKALEALQKERARANTTR